MIARCVAQSIARSDCCRSADACWCGKRRALRAKFLDAIEYAKDGRHGCALCMHACNSAPWYPCAHAPSLTPPPPPPLTHTHTRAYTRIGVCIVSVYHAHSPCRCVDVQLTLGGPGVPIVAAPQWPLPIDEGGWVGRNTAVGVGPMHCFVATRRVHVKTSTKVAHTGGYISFLQLKSGRGWVPEVHFN